MEFHAESLQHIAWQQRAPGWRDLVAVMIVLTMFLLVGMGARQMVLPIAVAQHSQISLDPSALPVYALHTTLRMLIAMGASLIFTLTYATLAARSRRAELAQIASALGLQIDGLFPVAEALHLLEFAELRDGALQLTAAGGDRLGSPRRTVRI